MPRANQQFTNSYAQLRALTPATLQRLSQPTIHRPSPTYTHLFRQGVFTHTDGSTCGFASTLPMNMRPVLVKDTVHHPLWNPRIRDAQVDKNSEEFLRFQRKFGAQTGMSQGADQEELSEAPVDILAELSNDADAQGVVQVQSKYSVKK